MAAKVQLFSEKRLLFQKYFSHLHTLNIHSADQTEEAARYFFSETQMHSFILQK